MKRKHLAAIVAALALALPSCGGDDSPDKPAPAAGTSPTGQAERPKRDSTAATPDASPSTKAKNGDGGSSAADAERAASGREPTAPSGERSGSGDGKRTPAAPKTPVEAIESLSPSQRRHLHQDLFEQGKRLCYVYGPEELARSFNLPSSDPETLARLLARAYEKATPSLILPYQQGCLAGLRKHARNPPKN